MKHYISKNAEDEICLYRDQAITEAIGDRDE